jgi:hypothetical protein
MSIDDREYIDDHGKYTKERMIWGEATYTPELHNTLFSAYDSECHRVGDGKWCFKRTELIVSTPNARWVFAGSPQLECVTDNQGSCGWNRLGLLDRYFVVHQNPTEIKAYVLTNSRSIGVRIGALARYYP